MRRLRKPTRVLVAAGTVLVALGGAVGAVGAFDQFDDPLAPPVQICIGTKTVAAVDAGGCPKNSTLVEVASAAQAEQLRSRVSDLASLTQSGLATLQAEVNELRADLAAPSQPVLTATAESVSPDLVRIRVLGSDLLPYTPIEVCSGGCSETPYVVGSDGHINLIVDGCGTRVFRTYDWLGAPIVSNPVTIQCS